MDMSGTNIPAA